MDIQHLIKLYFIKTAHPSFKISILCAVNPTSGHTASSVSWQFLPKVLVNFQQLVKKSCQVSQLFLGGKKWGCCLPWVHSEWPKSVFFQYLAVPRTAKHGELWNLLLSAPTIGNRTVNPNIQWLCVYMAIWAKFWPSFVCWHQGFLVTLINLCWLSSGK